MAVSGGVRQAALSLRSPQTLATSVDSGWRRGGPGAWDGRACSREVHLGSLFLFDPAIQQAKTGAGGGEEEDLKVSQVIDMALVPRADASESGRLIGKLQRSRAGSPAAL